MGTTDSFPPFAAFIERWRPSAGAENANAQLFMTELCDLLEVNHPDPACQEINQNAYTFERDVFFPNPDGSTSSGRIDLYKRGCFVCESKQAVDSRKDDPEKLVPRSGRRKKGMAVRGAANWITAMAKAKGQAESYARALPAEEGRPPFVLVVDVGYCIEIFAEFTRTGGAYIPFPDPRSYRIMLQDLRHEHIRNRLRAIWQAPMSLDPTQQAARVTQEIAQRLALLAKSLEQADNSPEEVASFLMRCLFTMFAEDVELLPKASFTNLLLEIRERPGDFAPLVESLWRDMKTGGFSGVLRQRVLHFNGTLFENPHGLALNQEQLDLLLHAAQADWRDVEPAIFGTLLERALEPKERHKLGAHYTPRAYVERLVMPTVVEPLREEWNAVKVSALTLLKEGKEREALQDVANFHRKLCHVRVLDPACGSGNFLYVCLEHFKRLEGEVLDMESRLVQQDLRLETQGFMVDPHQFLGLEVNPRAAAITDLVLWIGYLQWHLRTRGKADRPPEPIIKAFHNIQCRDALITWEKIEPVLDDNETPVTRWDGETMRVSPVTGEPVPDETARVPVVRYIAPDKAEWPEADFVVGNPPFIGAGRMRDALGEGYSVAVRDTWDEVPESCDFVMYWWNKAAHLLREEHVQRFGFITTNSIRQTFNRRILAAHMSASPCVSLAFAIPDHPWVDSADGAAVRIAMTVARQGQHNGLLQCVRHESQSEQDHLEITFESHTGVIHSDLTIGADVTAALPLYANADISCPGVKLHGSGFIVTQEQAAYLGLERIPGLERHIRHYRNGRDLTQKSRDAMVIDLFGLTLDQVKKSYPEVYQWVAEKVKPIRTANQNQTKDSQQYAKKWWLFGKPRETFRPALAGLPRYIATVETSKHRFFVFLDQSILPDNKLINIALDDAYYLGVLSSRVHIFWALAQGGNLGVGNDPVYVKTRCFETFPFPDVTENQKAHIRELGEALDAHRKIQLAAHPDLTMTKMYNVLTKLQAREELAQAERKIHEQGLITVLKEIHEDLDKAVLQAYGWPEGLETNDILQRLLDLNRERHMEEKQGHIRWLRPEYQNPDGTQEQVLTKVETTTAPRSKALKKSPWPKSRPEQAQAAMDALRSMNAPATVQELATAFQRANRARLTELLEAMVLLGQVRKLDEGRFVAR